MRIPVVFIFACLLAVDVSAQRTRNVVLVTVDGLRHQELFGGVDRTVVESGEAAGVENLEPLRRELWRESETERRDALMPFFWGELAPRGVVVRSSVANPHKNSFPGYAEILTGAVVPEITGNIERRIPRETVLEIAKRELGIETRDVAAFTSWAHFDWIVEHAPGTIFVNAGYENVPETLATPELARWSRLQHEMRTPWDAVRHNAVTVGLALAYIEAYRPRIVFVALDETDEWAHARRYDRTLQAIRGFDDSLRELWTTLQSIGTYRDRTTLVITTDHGRGGTPEDWTSHGSDVAGCEQTWIAIVGPDTPARGVIAGRFGNADVAPTILAALGLDSALLGDGAGSPIDVALR